MQQTETYKLNLIESSDPFSPNPLNENTEKLEAVIAAGTTALDERVTILEARKIVLGTYTGDTDNSYTYQTIELGFTPKVVMVYPDQTVYGGVSVTFNGLAQLDNSKYRCFEVVDGGFRTCNSQYYSLNKRTRVYYFAAFG